jgi:hypothetical protein
MQKRPFTFNLIFLTALVMGAILPAVQVQKKPPLREDFSAIVDINAGATGRIYS